MSPGAANWKGTWSSYSRQQGLEYLAQEPFAPTARVTRSPDCPKLSPQVRGEAHFGRGVSGRYSCFLQQKLNGWVGGGKVKGLDLHPSL